MNMNINRDKASFQSYWNIVLGADSYKASHHGMYPEGMTYMESYAESRGGRFPYSVFFGLQYFIKSYLLGQQVTQEKLDVATEFYAKHFGNSEIFDKQMWQLIIDKHNGHIPIRIKSVLEGSLVPIKNCLFKIESTDEKCAKIVNWVETLLMKVWSPTTVATNSFAGLEIIKLHLEKSGTLGSEQFLLHDFGYRGVASEEQAGLCGAAHLLSFSGTDTIAGIRLLEHFYGSTEMTGFSVPASEHSVMCSGLKENEIETVKSILKKFPKGPISIVADTWNVYKFCENIALDAECKSLIVNRDGVLVIRPDSGDPKTVLEDCLNILSTGFGYTTNSKAYKVLNSVKLIQGDGINIDTMDDILNYLEHKGWSSDNLIFGSGGGLLQSFNRDSMKFAIKACYIETDGIGYGIKKDPITSLGKDSKKSKSGKVELVWTDTGYQTQCDENSVSGQQELVTVYENGQLMIDQTYQQIKARLAYDTARLETIYTQLEQKSNND